MKLIDRYVLKIFASAAAIFTATFVALFLVIDFASRATRFFSLQDESIALFIMKYYSIRVPVFLHHTLPMVTVFSAAFTMIKLTKNNELLPIVASGTSLRRVAFPFLIAAILTGVANAALEEYVLPDLTEELARTDERLIVSQQQSRGIVAISPEGAHVTAGVYNNVLQKMEKVRFTKISPAGRKEVLIVADTAEWNGARQAWLFKGGTSELYDEKGGPIFIEDKDGRKIAKRDPIPPEGLEYRSDLTPRELRPSFSMVTHFSRLSDLIAQSRRFPNVAWLKVNLQCRFSFPLSGFVLLLIGMPFVSATTSKSFFRGLSLCFLVVIGFYGLHLVCLDLGQAGLIPPTVSAWGAVGFFGPLGAVFFGAMKT